MVIRRHTRAMVGVIFLTYFVYGNFLALSSVVALGANIICNKIPGLAPRQRVYCKNRPEAIVAVGEGAKLGADECQYQFRNFRWNCTSINSDTSMFGYEELGATKEAAFVYAITSAGVTYSITQACSLGNIRNCGCGMKKRNGQLTSDGFRWGGCSADIRYGLRMTRKFMDEREMSKSKRALMNLHNNRAGRKAVKDNLRKGCKCHGVSGSCTLKTCWTTLPYFRDVGDALRRRYRRAKEVVPYLAGRSHRAISLFLKYSKRRFRKPRRSHLVMLEESPNYCDFDPKTGSLGTAGRICNRSSKGQDGCDLMCCGRGYNTYPLMAPFKCACKFHWCCSVHCQPCPREVMLHACK